MKTADEQAFELLFRKYYVRLCGFANKFLYDPIESEEIVQEVFLNVWRKRELYQKIPWINVATKQHADAGN